MSSPDKLGFPYGPTSIETTKRPHRDVSSILNEVMNVKDVGSVLKGLEVPFSPINRKGGYREVTTAITASGLLHRFNGTGHGLVYVQEGSNPGGRLNFDFKGGGLLTNQPPGTVLPVQFDELEISRGSRSAALGNARIVILTHPLAHYTLPFQSFAMGALLSKAVGPGGAAVQTINDASANVPTTAGDGLDVGGARGLRVIVSAASGQTLSGGGSLRLWHFNSARARWVKTAFAYLDLTDGTSVRDLQFPDEILSVPDGEVYAEAVSVTTGGGASLVVTLETW